MPGELFVTLRYVFLCVIVFPALEILQTIRIRNCGRRDQFYLFGKSFILKMQ